MTGLPPDVSFPVLLVLILVSFVAGFGDAIAGGGGLLTLPALLLAGLPPHLALGTNKGQSVFGSGMALFRFAQSPLLDRRRAARSVLPALLGAALGVVLVSRVASRWLSPVVMVLLFAVAVLVAFRPVHRQAGHPRHRSWGLAALVALVTAAYDGFFGPGTGTFLIMAYVWLWRDPLDAASANAKVVNFCSNLAALSVFAFKGLTVWAVALPMGLGQAAGGYLGAHLTIRRGQGLVRVLVIVVSLGLMVRLGWQLFR